MKILLKILLQWTWGILQNIAGAVVFLLNARRPHRLYRDAFVTEWKLKDASMGLGMFIFMGTDDKDDEEILAHEYGHTVQSLILGPLYLPVIGLPSLVWANFRPIRNIRKRKNIGYFSFYPERWANRIAMKKVGKAPGVSLRENCVSDMYDDDVTKKE